MTTELQARMILKIAHDESTPLNGAPPESPDDTETWQEMIIEDAEDKGVFTSLLNAGLVASNGRGKDAVCSLTQAGFEEYKRIVNQKQQENAMKTITTDNLESLSKSQLADCYNVFASHLTDGSPVKSFRDVATGLRRVREIRSKVLEDYFNRMGKAEQEITNILKDGKWAIAATKADGVVSHSRSVKNGNQLSNFMEAGREAVRQVLFTFDITRHLPLCKLEWEISAVNRKAEKGEREDKPSKPSSSKGASEKIKSTKKSTKENKPKYTRADALSDTLKEMGNGTDQEIIAASNERYVQNGGKNNLKEASWSFRMAVPVLINLGVVSKDSKTGTYSINLK